VRPPKYSAALAGDAATPVVMLSPVESRVVVVFFQRAGVKVGVLWKRNAEPD